MTEKKDKQELLPLSKAAQYLLEECRMVLPGMQALFGFQLISVFSETFDKKLIFSEQILHLTALGLVAIGVALVMTPAAIHRYTGSRIVTDEFINHSTRLLVLSMFPLAVGVCIDFYLIARIITNQSKLSLALSLLLLGAFMFLWLVFPRMRHREHRRS
jgi:hypothetical protein